MHLANRLRLVCSPGARLAADITCIHACTHTYMHACLQKYVHTHICVCSCMCVYVCVYIYIYILYTQCFSVCPKYLLCIHIICMLNELQCCDIAKLTAHSPGAFSPEEATSPAGPETFYYKHPTFLRPHNAKRETPGVPKPQTRKPEAEQPFKRARIGFSHRLAPARSCDLGSHDASWI